MLPSLTQRLASTIMRSVLAILCLVGFADSRAMSNDSEAITAAEYFWDLDPGQGNGAALAVSSLEVVTSGALGSSSLVVNVADLSVGPHLLGLRIRNAAGWSEVAWVPVHVDSPSALATGSEGDLENPSAWLVTGGEYVWDADPGAGSGSRFTLPATALARFGALGPNTFSAAVADLGPGPHRLGVRALSANGQWGALSWTPVQIEDSLISLSTANESPLVAAEYFWQVDPGAGKGTPVTFERAQSVAFGLLGHPAITVDISLFPAGVYSLGMRTQDASQRWGEITWTPVEVSGRPLAYFNGQLHSDNVVVTTNGATYSVELQTRFAGQSGIFYSTDGSEPSGGNVYTGAFTMTAPFLLRFSAIDENLDQYREADAITTLITNTPGGGRIDALMIENPVSGAVTTSVTPVPNAGWTFMNWAGDATGTSTNLALDMSEPRSVQALFGTTLTTNITGSGFIVREPAQAYYPYGARVRLSAVPENGNYFRFWDSALNGQFLSPLDFVVTNATPTVKAVFAKLLANNYSLAALVNGEGQVSKSPQQSNYVRNASVTLTAFPKSGFHFVSWSGDVSGTSNPLSVVMDTNKIVTATFELNAIENPPPLISISASGSSGPPYYAPINLSIVAETSDPGGSVVQVTFFEGAAELGRINSPPFTFSWRNVSVGTHTVTAVALDDGGATTTSAPLVVTIEPPPNVPPVVALISPIATDFFRSPTNVLIVVDARDSDGSISKVDFYGNGSLLGSTNAQSGANLYSFTWTNAPIGVNPIFARAFDNAGASAVTLPRDVTVQPPEITTFKWSQANLTAAENAGLVTLTLLKTGLEAATVSYATFAISAEAGRDFVSREGTVSFAGNENSKSITIPLLNEYVVDGEKRFEVRLLDPLSPAILGEPAVTTVLATDDDSALLTAPLLDFRLSASRPADRGALQILLSPPNAQWRLAWENRWRASGDIATDLDPGNYPIEFRPIAGYIAPDRATNAVPAGVPVVASFAYTADPSAEGGSLSIIFDSLAEILISGTPGWRFAGETSWRLSGEIAGNIASGFQIIEFRAVPAWAAPSPRQVLIQSAVTTTLRLPYLLAPAPSESVTLPAPLTYGAIRGGQLANPRQPYPMVGQLRSSAGYGSGTAVRDHVVLTAAHVLFDESTTNYVSPATIEWFPERHAGEYEPRPLRALGFYVHTNYLHERVAERLTLPPGVSTAASEQWDVAAIYFDEPVARGGKTGYLLSTAPDNEYIVSSNLKQIVGYPIYGFAEGKMHDIRPGNFTFMHESGQLYLSAGFLSFPGNSGGPLFVGITQGSQLNYYPAGVYIGSRSFDGRTYSVIRSIDDMVATLIGRAQSSAELGVNFVFGGIVGGATGGGLGSFTQGSIIIRIAPAGAASAGAKWRLAGQPTLYESGATFKSVPAAYTVEFTPIPGYLTPPSRSISITANGVSDVTVSYLVDPALTRPQLTALALTTDRKIRFSANTPASVSMVIESSSNLKDWFPILTNTAPFTFENAIPSGERAFFRAVNR